MTMRAPKASQNHSTQHTDQLKPIGASDPLRVMPRLQREGKPLDPSITQEQVSRLVDDFYNKVRHHERLGVLFAQGMSQDWPDHLDRMKAFWRSMLMQTREYDGRPVPAHKRLAGLTPNDFAVWLSLFRQSAKDICPPSAAALYISRAETIAKNLQMALFFEGRILPADAFEAGVLKSSACEQGLANRDADIMHSS